MSFNSPLPLVRNANVTSFQADLFPTSLWGRKRSSTTVKTLYFWITLPAKVLETPTIYSYPQQGRRIQLKTETPSDKSEGGSRVTVVPVVLQLKGLFIHT